MEGVLLGLTNMPAASMPASKRLPNLVQVRFNTCSRRVGKGATGATWSGAIAPRMADGGRSGGPHTADAGVKCCRACTAAAPRSTVRVL